MEQWTIKRDGKVIANGLTSEIRVLEWMHKHTSCSMDWAMKYEGYSIEGRNTQTGERWKLTPCKQPLLANPKE